MGLLLAGLVVFWPVVTGTRMFFLRDIGTTHLPAAAVFKEIGFARENPFSSFGQPYLGNPNLLIAYPFPKGRAAIGIHVLTNLALTIVGMWLLLRELGSTPDAAFFGSLTFALSGYVLSSASSLNTSTTIAWATVVLALAVRVRRHLSATISLLFASVMMFLGGEPVLIVLTVVLIVLLQRTWRVAGITCGVLSLAIGVTAPVHLTTLEAARESTRFVDGYSFEHATAASLHPARLLETPLPFLFGDPERIGPGAFWGYEVSRGTRPYILSLAFGILPVTLSMAGGRSFWWWVLTASLLFACGGYLPGARTLYDILAPLHFLRFPIKFLFPGTLALSALVAQAHDRLFANKLEPLAIRTSRAVTAAAAISLLLAILMQRSTEQIEHVLVRLWWNADWKAASELVLAPIVAGVPARLFAIAVLLSIAAWSIGRSTRVHVLALHVALILELGAIGLHLLPTIDAEKYSERSPLIMAAQAMPGRVFERAGKDLDPIVNGMFGRYTSNNISELAIAQNRQGWALSGVRHGLRYAYDATPDGSIDWRTQAITNQLATATWPERLRWLRAVSVTSIITSDELISTGVRLMAIEDQAGIPTRLYAIADPLPEIRRINSVAWCQTPAEAFALIAGGTIGPAVVPLIAKTETEKSSEINSSTTPTRAAVISTNEEIVVQTNGDGSGVLVIARSITKRTRAWIDGHRVPIHAAYGHLIGVPVRSGSSTVRVRF